MLTASLNISELPAAFPVASAALQHLDEETTAGRVARWLLAGMNGPTLMTRVEPRHLLRAAVALNQGTDILLDLQAGFAPLANAWWQEVYEDGRGRGGLCLRLAEGHIEFQRVDLHPGGRLVGQSTFLVRSKQGYDRRASAKVRAWARDPHCGRTPRGSRRLRDWMLRHLCVVAYDGSPPEDADAAERRTETTRLLEDLCLMAMVEAEAAQVMLAAKFEEA